MNYHLGSALRRMQATGGRAAQMEGGPQFVFGSREVVGVGWVDVDIVFPVRFVRRPFIFCSGELAEGFQVDATNYPTWSIDTLALHYSEQPGGTRIYTGARIGGRITGPENIVSFVNWMATTVALVNPDRA